MTKRHGLALTSAEKRIARRARLSGREAQVAVGFSRHNIDLCALWNVVANGGPEDSSHRANEKRMRDEQRRAGVDVDSDEARNVRKATHVGNGCSKGKAKKLVEAADDEIASEEEAEDADDAEDDAKNPYYTDDADDDGDDDADADEDAEDEADDADAKPLKKKRRPRSEAAAPPRKLVAWVRGRIAAARRSSGAVRRDGSGVLTLAAVKALRDRAIARGYSREQFSAAYFAARAGA